MTWLNLIIGFVVVWIILLIWFWRRMDRPRPMTELIEGEAELFGVFFGGAGVLTLLVLGKVYL